jgi:endonuclease/exonuclease/phosphatase family metal-dependent hydrolase
MTDYFVAFWNVENLFDEVGSPRRSEKLQRTLNSELAGWTPAVVALKIAQLGKVIRQLNQNRGPDLLGVCEVENRHVLELLSQEMSAAGRHYEVAHADTGDGRGIDVAFIYDDAVFTAHESFSHFIVKRTATRDLFQVNFRTAAGRLLVVIGNHWPARIGGEFESEPYRIIAGETLAYFHERIRAIHGTNVAVLAMGDFNDEPFSRSLVYHARSEETRPKVTLARTAKFLNLMWPVLGQGIGTHYYDNEASVLDQFLVSKGLVTGQSGLQADLASIEIVRLPEMVYSGAYPRPVRFDRGRSLNVEGFSDHFPISMKLLERQ